MLGPKQLQLQRYKQRHRTCLHPSGSFKETSGASNLTGARTVLGSTEDLVSLCSWGCKACARNNADLACAGAMLCKHRGRQQRCAAELLRGPLLRQVILALPLPGPGRVHRATLLHSLCHHLCNLSAVGQASSQPLSAESVKPLFFQSSSSVDHVSEVPTARAISGIHAAVRYTAAKDNVGCSNE